MAIVVVLINILVDVAYKSIDPRIKLDMTMADGTPQYPRKPARRFSETPARRAVARQGGSSPESVLIAAGPRGASAPAIAPYEPAAQDLRARLVPPVWEEAAAGNTLLGTDHLGRDMLSG